MTKINNATEAELMRGGKSSQRETMSNIELRAHDFAIAAVNAYQSVENARSIKGEKSSFYILNRLIDVYLNAYNAMEEKLNQVENHENN